MIQKKELGQHWLKDPVILQSICDQANLTTSDLVLEIGPGMGTLTQVLAARAKKVIALEFDPELASYLQIKDNLKNVDVINGDILKFDLTKLPKGYKVVANLPYYITSKIIRLLLESPNPPSVAVLLVQKEVAERLAAQPGQMSILAISAQFYADVTLGPIVTAKKFSPPPKVDSQVVILKHRGPKFADIDSKNFFHIVKAGFSEKRKTLRNSLSGGLNMPKVEVEQLLQAAQIDPLARAEALSLEDWYRLVKGFPIAG